MTAIKQVENAIDTIRQDVIMAQKVTPDLSQASGFPLTLTWVTWTDPETVLITYDLNSESELIRDEYVNGSLSPQECWRDISNLSI